MLEQSDDGRYQAGTYYDYVKSVVEESLNHFLSDTTFPYDADASSGNRGGGRNDGERNGGGRGDFAGGMIPDNKDDTDKVPLNLEEIDQIARMETTSGVTLSGTYDTLQDSIKIHRLIILLLKALTFYEINSKLTVESCVLTHRLTCRLLFGLSCVDIIDRE